MIPTKTKAGGDSASTGSKAPSQNDCRATVSATMAKASQYSAAVSSNRLAGPGAIGSIRRHSTIITGDCQSP